MKIEFIRELSFMEFVARVEQFAEFEDVKIKCFSMGIEPDGTYVGMIGYKEV